jgi:outer membrane immunogenic protein
MRSQDLMLAPAQGELAAIVVRPGPKARNGVQRILRAAIGAAILGSAMYGAKARADAPPVSGFLFTVQPMTWSGFYLGGAGGYGSAHFDTSVPATFASGVTPDGSGWVGGVVVGYNHQIGIFVGGIEVDFMAGTLAATRTFPSLVDSTSWNVSTNFGTLASLRGRAGVAMGPVLVYGTVGGAWGGAQSDIAVIDTGTLVARGVSTNNHLGWVAGAGAEVALAPHWIIRGEWLHYELDSKNYYDTGQYFATVNPAPPFAGNTSVTGPSIDVGRVAIILKF